MPPAIPTRGSDSSRPKRIAVIAVHGVADQKVDDTANTAANLLLHMETKGAPSRYRGFKTHRLRIAHRAIKWQPEAPAVPGDPSEKCQHQFLRGQLEDYKEPDPKATYETIRNEGVREDKSGDDREVHIYEMYWADLSRLGNSFFTLFVELYQLLFHLCTVGAKTARFAREQHGEIRAWRVFSGLIHVASYFIRLPIPIANLFVLALIALAASGQIQVGESPIREIVIGAVPVALGVLAALYLRKNAPALAWPYIVIALALLVTGLLSLSSALLDPAPGRLATALYIEVWLILLALLWKVLRAYDRRHAHALEWGLGIGLVANALLLYSALVKGGDLQAVCKATSELLLHGLGASWLVTIISAGLAGIIGWRALRRIDGDGAAKARAHRAVFTANLTTALTGAVMLIINIALWGLIPSLLDKVIPAAPTTPGVADHYDVIRGIAQEMRHHLATVTIIPGMMTLVILIALAAVWMVWALIPAVRSEITTPLPETKSSRWIGESLTNAFRVMTWAGYLAIACFGGLLGLASILSFLRELGKRLHFVFLPKISYLDIWDKPAAVSLFTGFSGTILLLLIAPFLVKGVVLKLSAAFRQGLDVALDVINYLREHPADSTIRAQIFARYVSLLRYVCNWKSPIDGTGYDRIIIFAHSQGSVITVDLLRFLQVERDPELSYLDQPDRIRLFTMGCPLRQLYGLRFPHIYDWARHSGEPSPSLELPKGQLPDPKRLLSVGDWVNAYRSGDYVGRNLWRSEKDKHVYVPDVISEDDAKIRREFCIGGGAHIHYWDKTAPTIAKELDRLIETA